MLNVGRYKRVRVSLSIPKNVADLLESYAKFIAEYQGATVHLGDVVAGLIPRLNADKVYQKWLENGGASATEGKLDIEPQG